MRSRRPGCGLVLLVLLLVAGGLLVVADLTTRSVAEEELVRRLEASVPEAGAASVDIPSFPFLPGLLASGSVPRVDAEVRDIAVKGIRFDLIAVELHEVRLDRGQLLRDRNIVLQDIDRGEVRGEVGEESLGEALGVPVRLETGRAELTIAGVTVGANLSVVAGRLEVRGLGIDLPALDLTGPLLPCLADAVIVPGRVELSCAFSEIPAELR